jgi:hypothetical protein
VLSNRQTIYNIAATHFSDREFSRRGLLDLIDKHYPGTNHDSILPSDYLCKDAVKADPSNDGNRGDYTNYPRFLERLGRDRYRFAGWDGIARGSIDAPAVRIATAQLPTRREDPPLSSRVHMAPPRPNQVGTTDHEKLVAALRRMASSVRTSSDRAWRREPALRVLDCVLSLNRRYDSFVVPRLDRFEGEHPRTCSVSDLRDLISTYPSADRFVTQALNYNDEARAATLNAVVDWLVTVSGTASPAEQLANLERWAREARPRDYGLLGISGFGVAGFQYMRMLFGANTTKPDIHICRFVGECVGHRVSDLDALQLLENAALEAGVSLRDLDTTIWEKSARGAS